ncbi:MAG: ABC transporter ATP-binding protein [Granulosicoccus sp.]
MAKRKRDDKVSQTLVEVQGLSKRFDVSSPWLNRVLAREPKRYLSAVESVDFSIQQGSTFALVGESGSGKSTIAKMLVGLLPPSGGRVVIDGVDLMKADAAEQNRLRRRIQMIFQDPYASLNPRWRIDDIIAEPVLAFEPDAGKAARDRRVLELLEQVGLSASDAAKYPHEFSGGQRQRIGIARALASKPELIVCDEPTSALDVSVQAQVLNLMRDLQSQLGLTYLFITHDLSVVRYMADRIGVLYLGALVENAPASTLFDTPQHPYTRMLLEAAPRLDGFGRQHEPPAGEIPDPTNRPTGCFYHPRCSFVTDHCRQVQPMPSQHDKARVACHEVERMPAFKLNQGVRPE